PPVLAEPETPVISISYALPNNLAAEDIPNDKGQAIRIFWDEPKPKDTAILAATLVFWRRASGETEWQRLGEAPPATGKYVDAYHPATKGQPSHPLEDGTVYEYKVSVSEDPALESGVITASARGHWFNTERTVALVATIVYVLLVTFFIRYARSGKELFVRPISGIDAVEEAVGRATEMGKPVLYVPGIGEIQEVATLAGLTILSPIAEKVAEYDTPILVPNRDPIVYTVAQEIVREAYVKVGRPDAYNEDNIYFLSGRQFAYAAAVSGLMMRDKPATNFFFGMFYAESLILAETGAAIGAIQIAGTDQVAQLPFFIAACDYTLIGEELYAASAYLSGDAILVGSLKALDWMKVVLLSILGVSLIGSLFGWHWLAKTLGG
ncbi:MAG: hypothetical protein P9L99_10300, partial [Candidatus Lernaella stagnicola]|nr:hypothetical protein [Candidatus Lernaella stagnicola]